MPGHSQDLLHDALTRHATQASQTLTDPNSASGSTSTSTLTSTSTPSGVSSVSSVSDLRNQFGTLTVNDPSLNTSPSSIGSGGSELAGGTGGGQPSSQSGSFSTAQTRSIGFQHHAHLHHHHPHHQHEDDLVEVRTPLPSSPAASVASSRASSRTPSRSSSPNGRRSGGGKPRRDKTKEREKAAANANSRDILGRFPADVNGRVFGYLDVDDLLRCGLVCKKWRRSQTFNYTWYLLLQSLTWEPGSRPKATYSSTGVPTWRREDSKVDWASRFASISKREGLDDRESDVDEDGKTFKELREEKWREENEAREMDGTDKVQMRQYYKSLGNSKVKGKSGKGAERTWEGDGLGGVVEDPI